MCSCKKHNSSYWQMPEYYKTDSLSYFKEVIGSLKTIYRIQDNYLKVEVNDCLLIPFCGYLRYSGDTIFFLKDEGGKEIPFLFLRAKKSVGWLVNYSSERSDSIYYIGSGFDKSNSKDSLWMFQLKPRLYKRPSDSTFLKFITLGHGGIKSITFSNYFNDCTISLTEYSKVIYNSSKGK